jgi:sensor histidine kinase YesM
VHPLLGERRALFAYLLFWVAAALVPIAMLESAEEPGLELVAFLSTFSFGALTLPTWFLSRALSKRANALRMIVAHGLSCAVWSLVYRLLWEVLSQALSIFPAYAHLPSTVDSHELSLFALGALFYALVASFHHTLAEIARRRDALERQASLALSAERAELAALRAQVHPHFLFNALNTISALVSYEPHLARSACVSLGEYLRATLSAQDQALVTLSEEWALCETYLRIEALRLGDRLRLDVELSPLSRQASLPSLLLQPLVENAITHGIARDEQPDALELRAEATEHTLYVRLRNSYVEGARRRSLGRGLANVRARLSAHYGDKAELSVAQTPRHFAIELKLPIDAPLT